MPAGKLAGIAFVVKVEAHIGKRVVIFAIGFVLFCKADRLNKQYIHI